MMSEFARHDVPLAVAVIDMDWHITNPPAGAGSGWTGYTWDPELFRIQKSSLMLYMSVVFTPHSIFTLRMVFVTLKRDTSA